ncbi:MAG: amidohydrolase [Victivallales bacterium]|nr:amidohydrolase [Victivallales bacterium]
MRKIFDFHLHPFIDLKDRIGHYGAPASTEAFVAHLKKVGITSCAGSVVRPIDGKEFAPIREMNDQALRFRDRFPDFYHPGMHILPGFPDESIQELDRMRAEGVKLIGELVPYMMGYREYMHPTLLPVWEYAQKTQMLVSIHSIDIQDMEKLVASFPRLKVVMAHPGEFPSLQQKLEVMKKHPNAYLDICGTGLFRYNMLSYTVKAIGADRILFATDFPTCNPAMQVAAVDFEDITPDEREAIFHGNAERLLGLGENG